MKPLAATLIALAFVSCSPAGADERTETCAEYHDLAEVIMHGRQVGASMPVVMDIVDGHSVAVAIVRDAYEVPRYSTGEYQHRAKVDFANRIYADCLRVID